MDNEDIEDIDIEEQRSYLEELIHENVTNQYLDFFKKIQNLHDNFMNSYNQNLHEETLESQLQAIYGPLRLEQDSLYDEFYNLNSFEEYIDFLYEIIPEYENWVLVHDIWEEYGDEWHEEYADDYNDQEPELEYDRDFMLELITEAYDEVTEYVYDKIVAIEDVTYYLPQDIINYEIFRY